MAKKINALGLFLSLISLIVTIGVGGAFVSGMFMNVVILNFLPLLAHQVVGWVVIVGGILGAVAPFFK